MKKTVVIFDIDFTIFDTARLRQNRYDLLSEQLGYTDKEAFYTLARQTEKETKLQTGHFDPRFFLSLLLKETKKEDALDEIEKSFFDELFYERMIFEDTVEVWEKFIEKNIEIGIFSTGEKKFQLYKIKKLQHLLKNEHIHIFSDKLSFLTDVLSQYKNYQVFLVDDMLHILYKAKKVDPYITTILIERQSDLDNPLFYDEQDSIDFKPDKIISNLKEIVPLVL